MGWCCASQKRGSEEIRSFENSGNEIFSNYNETQSKEAKRKRNVCLEQFFFAASAAKFWKHDLSGASERAFLGVFRDIFGFSTLSKKRCFSTQEFTRFWHVLSNIVIWLLGHFWFDTQHINRFEEDSLLSKLVVCSPPSRSCRPRLGVCQRKRICQKWFRLRFRGVHEHPSVALQNSWRW